MKRLRLVTGIEDCTKPGYPSKMAEIAESLYEWHLVKKLEGLYMK